MDYAVRPYTDGDYDFVWKLHIDTNRPYIDRHMGVDEDNVRKAHNNRINASDGFIVEQNGKSIGCYFILENADYFELGRFFLIPEKQNHGLGTQIMRPVLDKYSASGKPILIHVWKDNPVQQFWQKLGFVFYKDNEPFKDMIYKGSNT